MLPNFSSRTLGGTDFDWECYQSFYEQFLGRGKCCPFFGSGLTLNSSLSDFGIRFGYEDALFFTPELLWERCNFKIECSCAADFLSAKLWCKIGEDAALLMQQFDFTAYCPFQLGWMLPKISLSAFWDASTVQLYHRARKQAASPLLQQSLGGQKKSSTQTPVPNVELLLSNGSRCPWFFTKSSFLGFEFEVHQNMLSISRVELLSDWGALSKFWVNKEGKMLSICFT